MSQGQGKKSRASSQARKPGGESKPDSEPAAVEPAAPPAAPRIEAEAPAAPPAPAATTAAATPHVSAPHLAREPRRTSTLAALGKFFSNNTSFFSSFIIGIAGLTATSTYQCNQSKLAERQADSQMRMAREQADNNWRIERAKILSQNLQTLTARGGDTAEQRYGVLLSLSRGNILDPDVSMSYALELGRDNPEYMRSVLSNIEHKDETYYRRLLAAYWITCEQRYGVSSSVVEACKSDHLGTRSAALSQAISDDLEAMAATDKLEGPMILLRDDREVHANLVKLTGMFTMFLQEVFERRQWKTIERFLSYSKGAKLVGSLILSTQIGDAGNNAEHEKIKLLHADLRTFFETFLFSVDCDHDCRTRLTIIMLSNLTKGQGQFVHALRLLLRRPRSETESLVARMNNRLLLCQIDPADAQILRDQVLVPVLSEHLKLPDADPAQVDDLIGLVGLIAAPSEPSVLWQGMLDMMVKSSGGKLAKRLGERRAFALQQRRVSDAAKPAKVAIIGVKAQTSFCQVAVDDRSDEPEE